MSVTLKTILQSLAASILGVAFFGVALFLPA